MDGVLLSSIGSVVRCWREWCRMYDVPNWETYEVPHGERAEDVIRTLRPDIDQAAGLKAIEDLELNDMDDLVIFDGTKRFLESLPEKSWTIVTSATLPLMEGRLRKAGLPMPAEYITAEMVKHGKPAPDPYIAGAKILGLSSADCVVVEDAPSGVGAGRAAGSRVLAVLNTHTKDKLPQATWHTSGLKDVRLAAVNEGVLTIEFVEG